MKSIKINDDGRISFECETEKDVRNVKELLDAIKKFGGESAANFEGTREGEYAENNEELSKLINETFGGMK